MQSIIKNIHIIIFNGDFIETDNIRDWLAKDMRVPYDLTHCVTIAEVSSRIINADLVILKPQMEGNHFPKQVFHSIGHLAHNVPIIVLADDDGEHRLSTYVMEQGAADVIIRGQFARIVDAIEFALIRQKITRELKTDSDKTLLDSKDKGASDLARQVKVGSVDKERHAEILRMFCGDYSVNSNG